MTQLFYSVNNMAADDLATQGARASTAMVLTKFPQLILVSAPGGQYIIVNIDYYVTSSDYLV